MPTIIAICPYCRAGGVRAPDTAIGASANCPKCKSSFTVVPSDDIPPDWDKPVERPRPKPSPVEETRSEAAMPDVTEPSPVLPGEAKSKSRSKESPKVAASRTPTPTAGETESSYEPNPPPDMGLVFALGALILIGPAMLISQVPYGRAIGLVVVLIGLVAGVLALVGGAGRAKPIGGLAVGLHLLGVLVLVFLPSWLGLDEWQSTPEPEPQKPVVREHGTGAAVPLGPGEWVEARNSSWEFTDARVTLRSAAGPVELTGPKDAKRVTKEHFLQLTVQVANLGAERAIPLSGWAAGQSVEGVHVVDSTGKTLAPATFDGGWAPARGRPAAQAVPGHASEVVWVFAAPAPKSEFVRVQLPGAALGVPDEIKFRVGVIGPAGLGPRAPGK